MKQTGWQTILRVLGYETACVDLVSRRPHAECVGRLRQNTNSVLAFFGPCSVTGYVEDTWFNLHKSHRQNAFKTVVRGTFIEESGQTRLRCRFGIPRVAFVATAISFSVLLVVGSMTFVASALALIGSSPSLNLRQNGILALLIFSGFSILAVGLGRFLARDEQRFLLSFLIETLDAREAPPTGKWQRAATPRRMY
jgi:hypothetical protein